MATLDDVVKACDERVARRQIADFPGAENGLQCANNGVVTKIGAAVDAGMEPFREAVAAGVDFLIVHHGMLWNGLGPVTGLTRRKLKFLLDNNLAVYSSHLPLDAHPEIGNNAVLADWLGLSVTGWFLKHEGVPIAARCDAPRITRLELQARLSSHFPRGFTAMEFGPQEPTGIAILTGSGRSAVPLLRPEGLDTLITGELRQEHFNYAQEHELNLYCCGHYATETYGVRALASEMAMRFELEWAFIETECPL